MNRESLYYICSECAENKKLKMVNTIHTVIKGLCGYCDREDVTYLTPVSDYDNPETGEKAVWD